MSLSHAQTQSFAGWIPQSSDGPVVRWTSPLVCALPSSPIARCVSPSRIHHQSPPCVGRSTSQPGGLKLRGSRKSAHPVERRGRRNESGCLTCRLRHKKCSLELDDEKRCKDCKSLNIECLRGYWKRYPPGLKDKKMKKKCLREIKGWTGVKANRTLPKPLPLGQFCLPPSLSTVNRMLTSTSTSTSSVGVDMTLAVGGTNGYDMPGADSDGQGCSEMQRRCTTTTCDAATFPHEANVGSYQLLPSSIPAEGDMAILRDQTVAFTAFQYHALHGAPDFVESAQYPTNAEFVVDPSTRTIAGSVFEGLWRVSPPYPSGEPVHEALIYPVLLTSI